MALKLAFFDWYGMHPTNIYLFKVNNRNTRKMSELCLKLSVTSLWNLYR